MNFEKFDDAPLETGQSLFLNKTLEVKAVFKPNRRKKSWLQKICRLFPRSHLIRHPLKYPLRIVSAPLRE